MGVANGSLMGLMVPWASHRAELTMSPAGGFSTPWALFSMSKMEVSKVGL